MAFLTPENGAVDYNSVAFIAGGTAGIVLEHDPGYVRKIPKIRKLSFYDAADHDLLAHMNDANRAAFEEEKRVYLRLLPYDGLVGGIRIGDWEIVMERLPRDLENYINNESEACVAAKVQWISSMIATMVYVHERHVLVDDIALRNFLLTKDLSLKMIDFGQCSIFPMDLDMSGANDDGFTIKTDLFHLACVIYSVSAWTKFECNLFERDMKWPDLSELPPLHDVFCEEIIRRCWRGEIADAQALSGEWEEWVQKEIP